MKRSFFIPLLAGAAALLSHAGDAAAQVPVILNNPNFSSPWPGIAVGNPATTLASCSTTVGGVGASASDAWTTYANTEFTSINSWILTDPSGVEANLVAVGGGEGGLVQVLAGQFKDTNVNRVGAWVYVVAGQAEIQLGNGGCGGGAWGVSSSRNRWEFISACGRPDMLNNEVTLYGVGPAVFYVTKADVWFDDVECLSCPHAANAIGAPLEPECGACAATVCGLDPHCCETAWDASCVATAAVACSVCL
jgi:hypothetical protein